MQQNEKFKDRLFRYRYLYRVRQTEKSKKNFLAALVTDISEIREDIRVMEYRGQKKYASRNVYVGSIENAERIFCTYYDAPLQHFGPYTFFDQTVQAKRTTRFIVASSLVFILLGLIPTLLYMQSGGNMFTLVSWQSFLVALVYGGYFYLLGKVTLGLPRRNTLVRNTSSVLTLLTLMEETKDSKTAFAFLDDGTFGENGLDAMRAGLNRNAKIFYLDSVGADAPLRAIGNDFSSAELGDLGILHHDTDQKINYLISARITEDGPRPSFYLSKTDLNQKELNLGNITKILELVK